MLNRRGRARRRALSWSVIAALALSAVAVPRAPEAAADEPGDPGLLDWCADTAPGDTGYITFKHERRTHTDRVERKIALRGNWEFFREVRYFAKGHDHFAHPNAALAHSTQNYEEGSPYADIGGSAELYLRVSSHSWIPADPHVYSTCVVPEPEPEPEVWVEGPASDVAEGGSAVFRIRLSEGAPAGGVSVSYRTLGGTAYPASDYSTASGTKHLPAGALSSTVTVQTTQDTSAESREWFSLRISNPTGATLDTARASARAWISDTDMPTVSVSRASAVEGGTLRFDLTLSQPAPSDRSVSVRVRTTAGTAESPADFWGRYPRVEFPAGAVGRSVEVNTVDDDLVEGDETFNLQMHSPQNVRFVVVFGFVADTATGTIIDNDEEGAGCPAGTHDDGAGGCHDDHLTENTCIAGAAYTVHDSAAAGGHRTETCPDDEEDDCPAGTHDDGAGGCHSDHPSTCTAGETYTVHDPTAAGGHRTETCPDDEEDDCPAGTHDDGAGGCHDDHPACTAGETYTVHDSTAPGGHRTKTCPDDDCAAGSHDDGAGGCHDDHLTPACALTSGQTHRVHPDPGDLSQHEDRTVDLCVLSAPSVTVPEDGGPAQVTFHLSGPAPRALAGVASTVETGSGDGTATAGDDFTAVDSASLTFAAGATASAPISVDVIDDTEEEPSERFGVAGNLPDLENGAATATVTILDNDDPDNGTGRVYTGAGVTVTEGETATVRFTVAPPPDAGDPVSAGYATVGTALTRPGEDFVAVSGTMTFTDSADTVTVDVDTIDDDIVETLPDIVTVSVGLPGGDTVEAQITILDNDSGNNNGGPPFEDPNPPTDRNCPTPGSHGHNDPALGWYCHDDHGVPTGCADVVQVSTVTDHSSWSVDACNYTGGCAVWEGGAVCWPPPPEPPCPSSFHYHGGYCHDHNPIPDRPGDEPLDCLAGRAQQYNTASHRTGTVKACPPPTTKKAGDADAGLSRLIVFAGEHLILRVEVDVTSPHVLTTRRLRVVAVNGCDSNPAGADCAEPGTHFEPLDIIISFNPSTPQPVEVQLKTLVDADHGTELRKLKFVISDPYNPEMDPIERSAWVEPPLRGTQ